MLYSLGDSRRGLSALLPRGHFWPVKALQNLERCDYRAGLFNYHKDEMRFASCKKFQAYILLCF